MAADYREISQQYAQGALKALVALNGGGIVAVGSQVSHLGKLGLTDDIRRVFAWWTFGLVVAVAIWIIAFVSTRYVDKSIVEERDEHLVTSDRLMYWGLGMAALSLVSFALGAFSLVMSVEVAPLPSQ